MTGGLWIGVWVGLATGSLIFLIGGLYLLSHFRKPRPAEMDPRYDPRDFPDERCPACQGTGVIFRETENARKCSWCGGSGWDPER